MLTDTNLEKSLDQSRPHDIDVDETVLANLDLMVATVSRSPELAQKSRRSWLRPAFLVPAIGVLVIATTAGAIAYSFSKTDAAVIPINYTTSNGQEISCGYGVTGRTQISGGSTAALRAFIKSHDWAGTGQKVYQYAISHPYIPTPSENGQFTQVQIDEFSFSQALVAVLGDEIPSSVEPGGYFGGGESDCIGTLR